MSVTAGHRRSEAFSQGSWVLETARLVVPVWNGWARALLSPRCHCQKTNALHGTSAASSRSERAPDCFSLGWQSSADTVRISSSLLHGSTAAQRTEEPGSPSFCESMGDWYRKDRRRRAPVITGVVSPPGDSLVRIAYSRDVIILDNWKLLDARRPTKVNDLSPEVRCEVLENGESRRGRRLTGRALVSCGLSSPVPSAGCSSSPRPMLPAKMLPSAVSSSDRNGRSGGSAAAVDTGVLLLDEFGASRGLRGRIDRNCPGEGSVLGKVTSPVSDAT